MKLTDRNQGAVQARGRSSTRLPFSNDEKFAILQRQALGLQILRDQRRWQKAASDPALELIPTPARDCSQQKRQRVQNDGLAGTGLPGEYGHALPKLEHQVVHQSKPFNFKF